MLILQDLIKNLSGYEDRIKYTFNDKNNLLLALTHSSFANGNKELKLQSNERLEFLGDSILNFNIAEMLYLKFPELPEGELTRMRASVVCEQSLENCANHLDIGRWILLGKGEEHSGGRKRVSILSDAFEATIGSIYIDGGADNAKSFIKRNMEGLLEPFVKGSINFDFKTQLQELIQKKGENTVTYELVSEKGPDHNKSFVVSVKVSDKIMGKGIGRNKKEAEQNAAKSAIEVLQEK